MLSLTRVSTNYNVVTMTAIRRFSTVKSASEFLCPIGFEASGVRCGIKKKDGMLDLAVIASKTPCSAAAVFTTNKFLAAPCQVSRDQLKNNKDKIHGVVVNAGCANACTGDKGVQDAFSMVDIANLTGVSNALVMSTGVIGPFLDMEKIQSGIQAASSSLTEQHDGWEKMSRAVMTTDTYPKLFSKEYKDSQDSPFRFAGFAKGAGMIAPNMATMLSTIVTDAKIDTLSLEKALKYATSRSFNSITIDGDTSTNDTLAVLANGCASTEISIQHDDECKDYFIFRDALTDIACDLAKEIVRDGEGATKFVTVEVQNGSSYESASKVAKSVCNSSLVKTALFGQDANWGRILCAVGYSGEPVDTAKCNLWFVNEVDEAKSLHLVKEGKPFDVDEDQALALLSQKDITIRIDLGVGKEHSTMWTCDFSHDYVSINADYRS